MSGFARAPITAVALAALLSITACSGSSAPSPTPSTDARTASPAPSSAPPAEGALPVPEQAQIAIGFGLNEMSIYAAVLADQVGIYEKYGLDVEYSVFDGEGRAVTALQAGQIDVVLTGMGNALSSQLTDAPYAIIGALAVILTDDLVCQAGIDTSEEVRGRTIAISTFGGVSNAAALIALKSLGLSATDAVITQVGGQTARLAALEGGSVDCAIVDSNLRQDMEARGFGIAAKLKEAGIQFGRSGVGARKEWLAANPNTALVVLASILEAQNMIFTEPQSVVPHYQEFAQLDEETATRQVNDFLEIGNRSLGWTEEAFVNPQKAIAAINPDIIDVNVEEAFDRTFLQRLIDIGFFESIDSPVP